MEVISKTFQSSFAGGLAQDFYIPGFLFLRLNLCSSRALWSRYISVDLCTRRHSIIQYILTQEYQRATAKTCGESEAFERLLVFVFYEFQDYPRSA